MGFLHADSWEYDAIYYLVSFETNIRSNLHLVNFNVLIEKVKKILPNNYLVVFFGRMALNIGSCGFYLFGRPVSV